MNEWIGVVKGKGKMEKSLTASDAETVNYLPKVPHLVYIQTGDEFEAGTDCKIELTFFGTKGTSQPIVLQKNESRFERGRRDVILVNIDDIESLLKVRVAVHKGGFRKNWLLDHIEVHKLGSEESKTVFNSNSWLDTKENPSVTLVGELDGKKLLSKSGYDISITTSDIRGAGTNAKVYITLFGEHGDSGELYLRDSKTNKNTFEASNRDEFEFANLEDLGDINKIRIWHDNSVSSTCQML